MLSRKTLREQLIKDIYISIFPGYHNGIISKQAHRYCASCYFHKTGFMENTLHARYETEMYVII